MPTIREALEAAEQRKRAAGISGPDGITIQLSDGEAMERRVFSGFDIDHEELVETVNAASWFFVQMSLNTGQSTLFKTCWTDGFLTGLMYASKLAPHHTTPGGEDAAGGRTGGDE